MDTRIMTLSQAVEGYLLHIAARRLTPDTITGYTRILNLLKAHFPHDPPVAALTVEDIEGFLAEAGEDVSDKTILNYHTALSSFYTWATSRRPPIVREHLMRQIPRPKPEERTIEPFTEAEVRAMLNNLSTSKSYDRPGKRTTSHSLHHEKRNRAIILVLVDTGIRSSELCDLSIADADLKMRRLHIFGKGKKERDVRMSARTAEAIWRYLTERPDASLGDPLFITDDDNKFTRHRLGRVIAAIAERAGVRNAHPHRFRHTFAVQFIRNHGDPFTLQDLLGHTTMEMVRRYLHLAQVDLDEGHKRASPVDNWRL
jgi:integrase/recombinase XerD